MFGKHNTLLCCCWQFPIDPSGSVQHSMNVCLDLCDITLLSSPISIRCYAHKARRRESGTHSKKLKTQWGEDTFLSFPFFPTWTHKHTHTTLKMRNGGSGGTLGHVRHGRFKPIRDESSCLRLLAAVHSWCCCFSLGIDKASLLYVLHTQNDDSVISAVVLCICSILPLRTTICPLNERFSYMNLYIYNVCLFQHLNDPGTAF